MNHIVAESGIRWLAKVTVPDETTLNLLPPSRLVKWAEMIELPLDALQIDPALFVKSRKSCRLELICVSTSMPSLFPPLSESLIPAFGPLSSILVSNLLMLSIFLSTLHRKDGLVVKRTGDRHASEKDMRKESGKEAALPFSKSRKG